MKSINLISKILILSVCINLMSCGKGDDGGGGGDDFFIPDLSATQWNNKADAKNTFFFLVDTEHVNHSTFTINENVPGELNQDNSTGSFTNHTITFTYNVGSSNNKGGKSYNGTINNTSTEIVLTSPNGLPALTLQK